MQERKQKLIIRKTYAIVSVC